MSSKIASLKVAEKPKDLEYLVTRTGRRLNRKNLFNERPFFPFLQLPAEIRNIIYRLVVVGDADSYIPVSDMNYREYHCKTHHLKRTTIRTPYWALTHDDEEIEPPTNDDGTWTCQNWTTYRSPSDCCQQHNLVRDASGILRVSRGIRFEALPLFYGENRFNFGSEWAMIPFFKDRTPLARGSILHVRIYFMLADDGHHAERQDRWIKNCEYIVRSLPQLESIELKIVDYEGRLLRRLDESPAKTKGKCMKWLPALMEIKNLKRLEVEIDISDFLHYASSSSSGVYQRIVNAEAKLLDLLEPKMLAKGVTRSQEKPISDNLGKGAPEKVPVVVVDDDDEEEDTGDSTSDDGAPFISF